MRLARLPWWAPAAAMYAVFCIGLLVLFEWASHDYDVLQAIAALALMGFWLLVTWLVAKWADSTMMKMKQDKAKGKRPGL